MSSDKKSESIFSPDKKMIRYRVVGALTETFGTDGNVYKDDEDGSIMYSDRWVLGPIPSDDDVVYGLYGSKERPITGSTTKSTNVVDLAMCTQLKERHTPSIGRIMKIGGCVIEYRSQIGKKKTFGQSDNKYDRTYAYDTLVVGISEPRYRNIVKHLPAAMRPKDVDLKISDGYVWLQGSIYRGDQPSKSIDRKKYRKENASQVVVAVPVKDEETGEVSVVARPLGSFAKVLEMDKRKRNLYGMAFLALRLKRPYSDDRNRENPNSFTMGFTIYRFQMEKYTDIKSPPLNPGARSLKSMLSVATIAHSDVLEIFNLDPSIKKKKGRETDSDSDVESEESEEEEEDDYEEKRNKRRDDSDESDDNRRSKRKGKGKKSSSKSKKDKKKKKKSRDYSDEDDEEENSYEVNSDEEEEEEEDQDSEADSSEGEQRRNKKKSSKGKSRESSKKSKRGKRKSSSSKKKSKKTRDSDEESGEEEHSGDDSGAGSAKGNDENQDPENEGDKPEAEADDLGVVNSDTDRPPLDATGEEGFDVGDKKRKKKRRDRRLDAKTNE